MSIEDSQVKARDIHRLQVLQSEVLAAQSQAQESLQLDMRVTQALLDKVSASTANLQSMMDESIARFRGSSSIYGTFGRYSILILCAMISTIIGALNARSGAILLLLGFSKFIYGVVDPFEIILIFPVHFLAG